MKNSKIILIISVVLNFALASCSKEDTIECEKYDWYQDLDGDGLGNKANKSVACEKPDGYVFNGDDDNDAVAKVFTTFVPSGGYVTPKTYTGLNLLWADEFDGTALNEKYWNFEIGNNSGWGNNELQYYKKENASVKDGYLFIEAKRESVGSQSFSSARLTTQNKLNFKYGRIDIRAVMPKGQGIWPALWMLGKNISTVNWPKSGEIDIMEMVGGDGPERDNTCHGTAHWDNNGRLASYGGKVSLPNGKLSETFRVYSLVWDTKKIVWYLDDKKFHEIDITPAELSEFQEEFFLLFNVAVGGNWPGSPDGTTTFPQNMIVDYVRVFQP